MVSGRCAKACIKPSLQPGSPAAIEDFESNISVRGDCSYGQGRSSYVCSNKLLCMDSHVMRSIKQLRQPEVDISRIIHSLQDIGCAEDVR